MTERINNSVKSKPHITEAGLDMTPIADARNFRKAMGVLSKSKDKFVEEDWKGGINKEHRLEDVVDILTEVYKGDIDPKFVTADEQYAFMQALQFAGFQPNEDLVDYLRKKARIKLNQNKTQTEKKTDKTPRRSLSSLAKPLAIAGLAASAAGAGLHIKNNFDAVNNQPGQPRTSEEHEDSRFALEQIDIPQETDRVEGLTLNNMFRGLRENIPRVKEVPKVEELSSNLETYNLWGFDFSPKKEHTKDTDIALTWDSENIRTVNGGEPLELIIRPEIEAEENRLPMWNCLLNPGVDCVGQPDNFILIGGHSGIVENSEGKPVKLAMEPLRAFIEGFQLTNEGNYTDTFKRDEREERMNLLEGGRATLRQGNHEAKVAIELVRIEEIDRRELYSDWSRVKEIALQYDPELGERINLDEECLIFATSGRRITGDKLTGYNHYPYTSSVIVGFACEAPPEN